MDSVQYLTLISQSLHAYSEKEHVPNFSGLVTAIWSQPLVFRHRVNPDQLVCPLCDSLSCHFHVLNECHSNDCINVMAVLLVEHRRAIARPRAISRFSTRLASISWPLI